MSSGSGRTISFTVDSPEFKAELVAYSESRGLPHVSDMVRQAVFDYIRRRGLDKLDAERYALLHEKLRG